MASSTAASESSSDLIMVLEKWLNEAKLGEGLIADMPAKVFLNTLIRIRHKPKLIELKKNTSASEEAIYMEMKKVMKDIYKEVTFNTPALLNQTDAMARASEKAKLALAIYFAAKLENSAPNFFANVTAKWSPAPAKTLAQAVKILQNAKCHGSISDHTFMRAFDPSIPPMSSAKKPAVPRHTFVAPRASSLVRERRAAPNTAANNSISAAQQQICQLQTQLAAAEAARQAAELEKAGIAASNAQLQAKMDELCAAVRNGAGNSSELTVATARLLEEFEADRNTRSHADEAVRDLERKLESALTLSDTCADMKIKIADLERNLALTQERLHEVEEQKSTALNTAATFREETQLLKIRIAEEAANHQEIVSGLKEDLKKAEVLVADSASEFQKAMKLAEEKSKSITDLLELKTRMEAELSAVQAEFANIEQQNAHLNTCCQNLGYQAQQLTHELEEQKRSFAEYVACNVEGSAKVGEELQEALTKLQQKQIQLGALESQLLKTEAELKLEANARESAEKKSIELESILAQLRSVSEAQAADAQRRISELESHLVDLQAEKRSVMDEKLAAEESAASLKNRIDELCLTSSASNEAFIVAQAAVEEIQMQNENLSSTAQDLKQQVEKLMADSAAAEKDCSEAREKSESLEQTLEAVEHQLATLHGELAVKNQQNGELQDRLEELEEKNAELEQKLRSLESLSMQLEATKEAAAMAEAERAELVESYNVAITELEGMKEAMAVVDAKRAEIAEAYKNAVAEVTSLNETMGAERARTSEMIAAAQHEVEKLKYQLADAERKNSALLQKLGSAEGLLAENEDLKKAVADAEARARNAEDDARKRVLDTVSECASEGEHLKNYIKDLAQKKDQQLAEQNKMMASYNLEMRELRRECDRLNQMLQDQRAAADAGRNSSEALQRHLKAYDDLANRFRQAQAQVAFMEETMKHERKMNSDSSRCGFAKTKRRSKSSHDLPQAEQFGGVAGAVAFEGSFDDFTSMVRVEELKRRNSLYPPMLRSCYPLEASASEQREDDVRGLNDSFWNNSHSQSRLNGSVSDGMRHPRETFAVPRTPLLPDPNPNLTTLSGNSSFAMSFSPPKRSADHRRGRPQNKENYH